MRWMRWIFRWLRSRGIHAGGKVRAAIDALIVTSRSSRPESLCCSFIAGAAGYRCSMFVPARGLERHRTFAHGAGGLTVRWRHCLGRQAALAEALGADADVVACEIFKL